MSRVLYLAYHYPPLGGGGVQRSVKFVRYLPEFGHEPIVVTGPGGDTTDLWTPEDGTLGHEIPAETRVLRIDGPEPPISTGWRRRAERILSIPTPYDRWWIEGAVAAGRRCAGEIDAIFGELVPYETAEAAARLSRELGIPWIADLQDPWALDEMWVYPSAAQRLRDLRRMRRLLGTADAIIMNVPEAEKRVARRFPELAHKLTPAIPNGFDSDDFRDDPPVRDGGRFRIVHTGFMHTDLGLKHRRTRRMRRLLGGMPVPDVDYLTRSHYFLVQAVNRLLERDPRLRDVLEVHLAGVLTDADRTVAATCPAVRLHGYCSHAESVALLQSGDLLFLPMHDLPVGRRAGLTPAKTYEYLGSGRPILAAMPDGDGRELMHAAGNALVCRPADVDGMVEAIATAVARWQAGEPEPVPDPDVVARYERRRQTGDLACVIDRVVDAAPALPV